MKFVSSMTNCNLLFLGQTKLVLAGVGDSASRMIDLPISLMPNTTPCCNTLYYIYCIKCIPAGGKVKGVLLELN